MGFVQGTIVRVLNGVRAGETGRVWGLTYKTGLGYLYEVGFPEWPPHKEFQVYNEYQLEKVKD